MWMKTACCKWGRKGSGAALLVTGAALCFIPTGCEEENPHSEWVKLPAELKVEIARTPEETQKGLMYRQHLPGNQGMYFVFEKERPLSFYMRATRIPLSIAFIASDGIIESIKDMIPLDERSVFSDGPAQFALEANRGWFDENGIRSGDKAVLEGDRVTFLRRVAR
jgi:uncharacterized membrane protein (UPF0127 family)